MPTNRFPSDEPRIFPCCPKIATGLTIVIFVEAFILCGLASMFLFVIVAIMTVAGLIAALALIFGAVALMKMNRARDGESPENLTFYLVWKSAFLTILTIGAVVSVVTLASTNPATKSNKFLGFHITNVILSGGLVIIGSMFIYYVFECRRYLRFRHYLLAPFHYNNRPYPHYHYSSDYCPEMFFDQSGCSEPPAYETLISNAAARSQMVGENNVAGHTNEALISNTIAWSEIVNENNAAGRTNEVGPDVSHMNAANDDGRSAEDTQLDVDVQRLLAHEELPACDDVGSHVLPGANSTVNNVNADLR